MSANNRYPASNRSLRFRHVNQRLQCLRFKKASTALTRQSDCQCAQKRRCARLSESKVYGELWCLYSPGG